MRQKVELDTQVVARLLAARGWFKSDLAQEAGISVNSVTRAAAGLPVGIRVASAISEALKKPLKSLLRSALADSCPRSARDTVGNAPRVRSASPAEFGIFDENSTEAVRE